MDAGPEVWTDGSLLLDEVSGASAAGTGVFAYAVSEVWNYRCLGHLDAVPPLPGLGIMLVGIVAQFLIPYN